jgi:hypothetical protein
MSSFHSWNRTRQACVFALAAFGAFSPSLRADDAPAAASSAPGRDVSGVLSLEGQPIESATITLCDADTGVPLIKELRRPPAWSEHRLLFENVWFSETNGEGRFQFENVPPGRYRLFAQQWEDAGDFSHPFDVRDRDLKLLGDISCEVSDAGTEGVEVEFAAAPGPNQLVIDGDIDEVSLILVSGRVPQDAVLGPFSIAGPFATHLLGYCRGRLTIEGLPDGEVGVAIFILDNSPGMNTYKVDVANGEIARIDVREEDMLAGWSNARTGPLPGLEAEMEEVGAIFDASDEESLWTLITTGTPAAGTEYDHLLDQHDFERVLELIPELGDLQREIALPSGHETTIGKVLAAMAYCEMARAE